MITPFQLGYLRTSIDDTFSKYAETFVHRNNHGSYKRVSEHKLYLQKRALELVKGYDISNQNMNVLTNDEMNNVVQMVERITNNNYNIIFND